MIYICNEKHRVLQRSIIQLVKQDKSTPCITVGNCAVICTNAWPVVTCACQFTFGFVQFFSPRSYVLFILLAFCVLKYFLLLVLSWMSVNSIHSLAVCANFTTEITDLS